MRLKIPYIGFGGALAITELIVIVTAGLLGMSISSCSGWWAPISCAESLFYFFLCCLGIGCLFWAILMDGQRPHKEEETLQAPRRGVRNPQHFH